MVARLFSLAYVNPLLSGSGKGIEKACRSRRMLGFAARRFDTLAVQLFGGGSDARDD
jgi:hypothetical protein